MNSHLMNKYGNEENERTKELMLILMTLLFVFSRRRRWRRRWPRSSSLRSMIVGTRTATASPTTATTRMFSVSVSIARFWTRTRWPCNSEIKNDLVYSIWLVAFPSCLKTVINVQNVTISSASLSFCLKICIVNSNTIDVFG